MVYLPLFSREKYSLMYPCCTLVSAATYSIVVAVDYFTEKMLGLLE